MTDHPFDNIVERLPDTDDMVVEAEVSLTPDQEIDERIKSAGISQEQVDAMYATIEPHAKPITTNEEYLEAKKALKQATDMRLKSEKLIEKIHTGIVALWKRSNAAKSEKLAWVGGPEAKLKPFVQAYEEEQARIRKEEEERVQAMKEERKNELLALGYTFVPGPPAHMFVLGEVSITMREVLEDDHETWTNKFRTLRSHAETVAETRRQEEEERRAFQAALDEQAEANRQEEARLQAEREELQKQKGMARMDRLWAIGAQLKGNTWFLPGDAELASDQFLMGCEDQHFTDQIEHAKGLIEADARKKEIEAERKKVNAERCAELLNMGCEVRGDYIGVFLPTGHIGVNFRGDNLHSILPAKWEEDKEFVAKALKKKAELAEAEKERIRTEERERIKREEQQAAEKEKERQAALSDVQLWEQWMEAIRTSAPKLTSATGTHAVKRVLKHLEDLSPNVLKDLKR